MYSNKHLFLVRTSSSEHKLVGLDSVVCAWCQTVEEVQIYSVGLQSLGSGYPSMLFACQKAKCYIQTLKYISNLYYFHFTNIPLAQISHSAKLIMNRIKAIFLSKRYGHWPVSEHPLIDNLSHQFWSYSKLRWYNTLLIRHIQITLNKYLLDINCVSILFNLLFLEPSPLCRFSDKNPVTISLDFLAGRLNVHSWEENNEHWNNLNA